MLLIEYTVEGNRPVILEFQSGSRSRDIPRRLYGFKPYIRIPKSTKVGKTVEIKDKWDRIRRIPLSIEEDNVPCINGDITKKLFAPLPSDLKLVRELLDKSYENDLLYPDRYLIDEVKTPLPNTPYTTLYFDIETDTKGGFEPPTRAKKPIIMISLKTNKGEPTVVLFWQNSEHKQKIKPSKSGYIFKEFNNEKAVVKAFISFVKYHQPDIMAGQNVNNYDMPYLYNRCKNIGVPFDSISPLGYSKAGKLGNNIKIPGRIIYDMMEAYAIANPAEPKNLGAICEKFGVKRKTSKMIASQTSYYWRYKLQELLEYSAEDVDNLAEIEEKSGMIAMYDEIHRFVGCQLIDVFGRMKMSETYIMRETAGEWCFPSRSDRAGPDYRGVPPLDTIVGMHKNGAIFDVESMHPTIQRAYNLSEETVTVKNGKIVDIDYSKEGFMVKITTKLLKLKAHFYKLRDESEPGSEEWKTAKRKAAVVKQIMNTTAYGLFGAPHSRIYNLAIAKKITEKSEEYLHAMGTKCTEMNCRVVAGDTDSTHALLNIDVTENLDAAIEEAQHIASELTKAIRKLVPHGGEYFNVGLDIIYSNSIYRAKKRYALRVIWDKAPVDRIEIKGLDVKRGNCSQFTKVLQQKLIEKILHGKSDEELRDYIIKMRKIHRDKSLSQSREICLPMKVHKKYDEVNNPWSRGAVYANAHLGGQHSRGDRLLLLYTVKKRMGLWTAPDRESTDVVCLDESGLIDLPEVLYKAIDWHKMDEHNVIRPVQRVLEVCGMSFHILVDGQTDIGKWF